MFLHWDGERISGNVSNDSRRIESVHAVVIDDFVGVYYSVVVFHPLVLRKCALFKAEYFSRPLYSEKLQGRVFWCPDDGFNSRKKFFRRMRRAQQRCISDIDSNPPPIM